MTSGLAVASLPIARALRRRLPAPVADTLASGSMVGIGWLSLAGLERLSPFREDWAVVDDETRTDRAYLGAVVVPTVAAAQVVTLAVGTVAAWRGSGSALPARRINRAPLPVRVGAALLVSELVHYWHHRLAHEVPVLWDFHEVHHSMHRLYWLNGTRFHPADEVPLLALQTVAVDALGIDRDAQLVHHVFKSINGLLQHANLSGRAGPMRTVMSTSDQHRLHHSTDRGPGRNYGAVLSVWDRVFGTLEVPEGPFVGEVGLVGGAAYPDDVVGQLLEPFRRVRSRLRRRLG